MDFKRRVGNGSIYTRRARFTIFSDFDVLCTSYSLNSSRNNGLLMKSMNLEKADIPDSFVLIILALGLTSLIEKVDGLDGLWSD